MKKYSSNYAVFYERQKKMVLTNWIQVTTIASWKTVQNIATCADVYYRTLHWEKLQRLYRRNNTDKNYYTEVYIHESTKNRCVLLNFPIGLGKKIFPEYILKFDVKYTGKNKYQHSGNIFLISTCVVTCEMSGLADAQCLLACVAAMLEAACQLLSRLYCLEVNSFML